MRPVRKPVPDLLLNLLLAQVGPFSTTCALGSLWEGPNAQVCGRATNSPKPVRSIPAHSPHWDQNSPPIPGVHRRQPGAEFAHGARVPSTDSATMRTSVRLFRAPWCLWSRSDHVPTTHVPRHHRSPLLRLLRTAGDGADGKPSTKTTGVRPDTSRDQLHAHPRGATVQPHAHTVPRWTFRVPV